jgi:beta-phosphoglucomutase
MGSEWRAVIGKASCDLIAERGLWMGKTYDTARRWGVIFDMDGVLIDSYRAHFEAWQKILPGLGLEMTEDQFAPLFGRTNADILAALFPTLPAERYPVIDKEKETLFREILLADFPEMDGAAELIAALDQAGAALAIGSSAPPENVQVALDRLSVGEKFQTTTNGSEITLGKPDPEVFVKTARKIRVPPSRCVVVEDAPAGVAAAKAAGCAAIALIGTAPRSKLSEADLTVDSLRELTPEIIRGLLAHARKTPLVHSSRGE